MRSSGSKHASRVIKEDIFSWPQVGTLPSGPRVLAVTSGKGGVGKTSLAVNLGVILAAAGNRVLIFDADLGLANAEVLLGISPPRTLYDCLQGKATIRDIICPGPAGVGLISGGSGFMEMANLSDKLLKELMDSLQVLDREADYVIVDTAAGISKHVLAFVAAVEELIMVVTPEPTSLTDAYSLTKIIAKYNLHQQVQLVINKAAGRREALETLHKFKHVCTCFLNLPINYLGYIPEDSAVPEAIKAQEPITLYRAGSPAAKHIVEICTQISGSREDNTPRQGLKGFAGKLIRLIRR